MSREINIKAMINKANGQISASFPKKKMPKALLDLIREDPSAMRMLKVRVEAFK